MRSLSFYCSFAVAVRTTVAAAATTESAGIAAILYFGTYCSAAYAATKITAANKDCGKRGYGKQVVAFFCNIKIYF